MGLYEIGQSGILNDMQIRGLCEATDYPMISPFIGYQEGKPSYGLGSFGFDIRLGKNFLLASRIDIIADPIDYDSNLCHVLKREDEFILHPGHHVLTESVETFNMPNDVCGVCYGKSSYARCGLLTNLTPLEPGWKGILTLELANVSPNPIRLHVGKGIAQVVFFRGDRPDRTYTEKESGGIYQNQIGVTVPL